MTVPERVRELVAPLVEAAGLEVYDLEMAGGTLRVLVDATGGADLDALSKLSRSISRALDEHDPIAGSYLLEVSTPGLERPLRTAAHFRSAVGSTVKVKTKPGVEGDRRVEGTITEAGPDTVTIRDAAGTDRTLRHDDIERARTTFDWGPAPKPVRNERKATKS